MIVQLYKATQYYY